MDVGSLLPVWSIVPFIGMLLSIAIIPLVKPEWWEHHQLHVALAWSLIFVIPFGIVFGIHELSLQLAESIVLDYIPFIVLLLGLFVVAGGIVIKGTIIGTTKVNMIILSIGTLLASFIGTTGAAMLFIRPLLRANAWRKYKAHTVIFFIFMVANLGGSLTPLGDPPLFLGYLRGVPFFWTFQNIWHLALFNAVILLLIYFFIDKFFLKKEYAAGRHPEDVLDGQVKEKVSLEGAHNIIFLVMILIAVILNGSLGKIDAFIDPA
ncbi:MAG: sodium:proton antiporter, partial [Coriobacteriia bacterium]|nr:sodium:proton antiporter [Coriobacteriia bacterium]